MLKLVSRTVIYEGKIMLHEKKMHITILIMKSTIIEVKKIQAKLLVTFSLGVGREKQSI